MYCFFCILLFFRIKSLHNGSGLRTFRAGGKKGPRGFFARSFIKRKLLSRFPKLVFPAIVMLSEWLNNEMLLRRRKKIKSSSFMNILKNSFSFSFSSLYERFRERKSTGMSKKNEKKSVS